MPLNAYTKNIVLFNAASANSSTFTSGWQLTADYAQISVSWTTGQAVASLLTIQGSNDDGLDTAIAGISNLSGIASQGLFAVTPGPRWIRVQRSSLDSRSTVILQVRT